MTRKSYPSDVSDEEWAFFAPYLTLMKEVAPQREYALRELFNALPPALRVPDHSCGRAGLFAAKNRTWRMLPHDFPRWETVYAFAHLQISKRNGG